TEIPPNRGRLCLVSDRERCPSEDVGDDFRSPGINPIPVVFAQGDWDISTPVENTYEIAPFFPNSHTIIAEQGGHGVLAPIAEQLPEVWDTLLEFLRTGAMDKIPSRVTLEPSEEFVAPAFQLNPE
ncbi:MAG: alpha/beta hydrolase, partial [Verrucomicrobiota bacterium]